MESNIKIVNVSKNLGIEHWPKTPQDGLAIFDNSENSVSVAADELAPLLAALTKAAGEMGVETAQGDLVKACKAAMDEYARVILAEYGYAWETPAIKTARQALARAE